MKRFTKIKNKICNICKKRITKKELLVSTSNYYHYDCFWGSVFPEAKTKEELEIMKKNDTILSIGKLIL